MSCHRVQVQELTPWNLTKLQDSAYNPLFPIKVLIHGFMTNTSDRGGFIQTLKNGKSRKLNCYILFDVSVAAVLLILFIVNLATESQLIASKIFFQLI
jgi:hypothetical protein